MFFSANVSDLEAEGLGAIEQATRTWQQTTDHAAGAFWDDLHAELYAELERRDLRGARYQGGESCSLFLAVMDESLITPKARALILRRIDDLRKWWAALHRPATAFFLARLLDACERAFDMTAQNKTEVKP